MAQVMADASGKLINLAGQGEYRSAVMEFPGGKMVLLNDSHQLLVLADRRSNLGRIILLARKTMRRLSEPDMASELASLKTAIAPDRDEATVTGPEYTDVRGKSEISEVKDSNVSETLLIESDVPADSTESEVMDDEAGMAARAPAGDSVPDEGDREPMESPGIPEVKPPLSLPELRPLEVPGDPEGRIETALTIYEHVLLAMSIGASKIMGVAPAGGMLRKSLPYIECPETLRDVKVLGSASLDFRRLRENIEGSGHSIEKIKEDFERIITSITENYGRVMGYDAFRGMIRPEFSRIHRAYRAAMDELGITGTIHPELRKIWEE
ncbi:roadblock/LC7 domain-containing protein [Methanothermobacter thermautotrophicus]|nr:roadblock/LC7 domain-containing protein [Methanothermobacter thermautotrophicus]